MRYLIFLALSLFIGAVLGDIKVVSLDNPISGLPNAGMILLPGAYLKNDAYLDYANVLVDFAQHYGVNLFVAIPNPPLGGIYINAASAKKAINECTDELIGKMNITENPLKKIFVAGHSMGGVFIKELDLKYAGLLFYAATLEYNEVDVKVRIPSLQLVGERDGQMRLTKMAKIYNGLKPLFAFRNFKGVYPLVIVPELTHSAFTNVPRIQNFGVSPDLPPIVSKLEGYEKLAKVTLDFITVHYDNGNLEKKASSLLSLTKYVDETAALIKGYLSVLSVKTNDVCTEGQAVMAGNVFHGVKSNVRVYENLIGFVLSKPEYNSVSNQISIPAYVSNGFTFPPGRFDKPQSPEALACKCESADSLAEKRKLTLDENTRGDCQSFMKFILKFSEKFLTPDQLSRYKRSGKVLVAGPSSQKHSGAQWVPGKVKLNNNEETVEVSGVEMLVPMDSRIYPGKHYCKVLHPARIVEYMIIDAFY